jgi:hypothetical protein
MCSSFDVSKKESNGFVKVKSIQLDAGIWGKAQYFQLRVYWPDQQPNELNVKHSDLCCLLYRSYIQPFECYVLLTHKLPHHMINKFTSDQIR